MHRGREARLDRLIRRTGEGNRAAVERHRLLRARAAIGAAIRWSLAHRGIDPARAAALLVADEAAAELAALGDPPLRPCAERPANGRALSDGCDPPDDPESRDDVECPGDPDSGFDSRIGRLVARYRGDLPADPDLARASLAELFAWCIAAADGPGST
jgi:hypothetical protein